MSSVPKRVEEVRARAEHLAFDMNSADGTGQLLASLVAAKPSGRFLELGTGIGVGLAWILSGMDDESRIVSVDTDSEVQAVAQGLFGADPRLKLVLADGGEFVQQQTPGSLDLIFADAWPGKYSHLDETLALLKSGGIYLIDDLLPQPNWPGGHQDNVDRLRQDLRAHSGFVLTEMNWDTGLAMLVKKS